MINHIDKGGRLDEALEREGMRIREMFIGDQSGVWENRSNKTDEEINAFIADYDPLPEAKADAKKRINIEASRLIAKIYPLIDGERDQAAGLVNLVEDILVQCGAISGLSGDLLAMKEIHDKRKVKVNQVDNQTDWQLLDAYDATIGW